MTHVVTVVVEVVAVAAVAGLVLCGVLRHVDAPPGVGLDDIDGGAS